MVSWHFLDICSRSLILFSKKKVSKSFKNNENRKGYIFSHCFTPTSLIACYLKIFIILYADDTVILSESAESLQEAISAFEEYCNIWKLTVNTNKTKIVVFSKKKYKTNVVFKIYGHAIDLQDSYSYLGVIFNYNGNFCLCLVYFQIPILHKSKLKLE
jgi:hypothetical protein